jgi:hypothetical protein
VFIKNYLFGEWASPLVIKDIIPPVGAAVYLFIENNLTILQLKPTQTTFLNRLKRFINARLFALRMNL